MTSLRASRRDLVLLGIVALIVLVGAFFWQRYRAGGDLLLYWQDEASRGQRVVREAERVNLDALRQELAQARSDLGKSGFPAETQALQVTSLVVQQAEANRLQVGIGFQRTLEKVGAGNFVRYLFRVQARGDPAGLTRLLEALQDPSWPTLLMDKIDMAPGKDSWDASFELSLYAQPRLMGGPP